VLGKYEKRGDIHLLPIYLKAFLEAASLKALEAKEKT